MKLFYYLRVFFLSVEACILAVGFLSWVYLGQQIQSFASSIAINDEALKYLMFLPAALAAWIFNEARVLLQDDSDTFKILVKWPDYWKLKSHLWVSLFYAVFFASLSLVPWIVKSGISSVGGLLIFTVSILGQLTVAISVYFARISIKEVVVNAESQY
ncbi:hypothetical protein [Pseudomonas gingeri]|uniref:hypothetical protein n=1 Tax=Pseudomonas gingeri TaxID=117681 RepID=UPI0015A4D11E|nr:hypothetical protein [Pseudomonas gingeri]NWE46868.1 hypothetical protein [Pseudomonas gingeri]